MSGSKRDYEDDEQPGLEPESQVPHARGEPNIHGIPGGIDPGEGEQEDVGEAAAGQDQKLPPPPLPPPYDAAQPFPSPDVLPPPNDAHAQSPPPPYVDDKKEGQPNYREGAAAIALLDSAEKAAPAPEVRLVVRSVLASALAAMQAAQAAVAAPASASAGKAAAPTVAPAHRSRVSETGMFDFRRQETLAKEAMANLMSDLREYKDSHEKKSESQFPKKGCSKIDKINAVKALQSFLRGESNNLSLHKTALEDGELSTYYHRALTLHSALAKTAGRAASAAAASASAALAGPGAGGGAGAAGSAPSARAKRS